ncbi:flavin prenyltransferase UbiX [Steroidobacter flavus]|uniref:Flavin prenyltransferase UbiX n=1 Tax=Steroidobacter flavus TaxID=1842136 RepID=A0ABV8T121_9GAMM
MRNPGTSKPGDRISVAFTGASGLQYGLRLLQCLLAAQMEVYVMVSKAARAVFAWELDVHLPGQNKAIASYLAQQFGGREEQVRVFGDQEWTAPVASGSGAPRAMVVCPCSMGTLSSIAVGSSHNLITRAADVVIKERRQLILVPRETPFSLIHLRNMTTLAELGAVILPANPGFYHRPQRVEQIVDFIVARILDQLDIAHDLTVRWGAPPQTADESNSEDD